MAPAAQAPEPATYRSAADIIVIGPVQGEKAAPNPSSLPASEPPVQLIPAPIQIGFDDLPDLPQDWTPDAPVTPAPADSGATAAPTVDATAEAKAAPLPEADVAPPEERPAPASSPVGRTTRFTPASPSPAAEPSAPAAGVRGQALRIGWEEDHSWRVVKSVPDRHTASARRPVWPLVLVALAVLAGAGFWLSGRTTPQAAACCMQTFTVSGSQLPVRVTLVQGPPGNPLSPGALIGTAPGNLKFPDAPGRYTLNFSAAGHGTLTGAVTVPSSTPFRITLK